MISGRRVYLIALTAIAMVTGCATQYQSSGLTGGFKEKKLNDSAYIVEFQGNGFATQERVWYFWIYRCAELTLKSGYPLFTIRTTQNPTAYLPNEQTLLPAVYYPDDQAQLIKVHGGGGGVVVVTGGGGTVTRWTSKGTVLMFQRPLPAEIPWGLDAQTVIDQLKPYVTSNGKAPAPGRNELAKIALKGHARIEYGDQMQIGLAADSPPSPLSPRSFANVQSSLNISQVLVLHELYRQYLMQGIKPAGGKIVLNFTISANGVVRDCKINSSTFTDRNFVGIIYNMVRTTAFSVSNVADTSVTHFVVSFAPESGQVQEAHNSETHITS